VQPSITPGLTPSRLGPVRRVLFFGRSMSRTRCTGALVDSLRAHGVTVRWSSLPRLRRWLGVRGAPRARGSSGGFADVVFVFRDLPAVLADEFRDGDSIICVKRR
jgi:hypothetical protein